MGPWPGNGGIEKLWEMWITDSSSSAGGEEQEDTDFSQHPNCCSHMFLPHHCGSVHVQAAPECCENEVLQEEKKVDEENMS